MREKDTYFWSTNHEFKLVKSSQLEVVGVIGNKNKTKFHMILEFDRYRYTDTDISVSVRGIFKQIPISPKSPISIPNRYRYPPYLPYQTDTDTGFIPIFFIQIPIPVLVLVSVYQLIPGIGRTLK